MKAFAIVIRDDETSEYGFERLNFSSKTVENSFKIQRFDAAIPSNVESTIATQKIYWNWPHTGSIHDPDTGITKIGYGGKDPKRRKACGISHYLLWKKCFDSNEPLLILEHDAIFNCNLDVSSLLKSEYEIIGINDPRGATRLAGKFHSIAKNSLEDILPVPEIDRPQIAQGLAGNSAYLIKPRGAQALLELVSKYGMWNNDAIMCRQLLPDMLGVTKTYYTKTQSLPSTTMN